MPATILLNEGEERSDLEELVRRGQAAGWKVQRTQAPLKCVQGPEAPA